MAKLRGISIIEVEINFEYQEGIGDLDRVDTIEVEHGSQERAVSFVAFECLLVDVDHLYGRVLTPNSRKSILSLIRAFKFCTKLNIPFFVKTLSLGSTFTMA